MSTNYLLERVNQVAGSNSFAVDERARKIAENVKRLRDQADISQAELAAEAGVAQNTIAQIELGKTRETKKLNPILRAFRGRGLNVSMADIDPESEGDELVIVPRLQSTGPKDLEVYGTEEAAGVLVISRRPVKAVERPEALAANAGGYGVIVAARNMIPALRPGYIAFIDPHAPARIDSLCLFRQGGAAAGGAFYEYRGETATHWKVKEYSPKARSLSIKKSDWPRCHKVVEVRH